MCKVESEPMEKTITLTWTAPGDDGTVGFATSYDVRYHTEIPTFGNWDDCTPIVGSPVPDSAGTPQEFIFTQVLDSDTEYFYAIKSVDEAGNWSLVSQVWSFRTFDITPPSVITDLTGSVL